MEPEHRRRLVGLIALLVFAGVVFATAIVLTPHEDVAPIRGPGMPWALFVLYGLFGVFVVTFFLLMPKRGEEAKE